MSDALYKFPRLYVPDPLSRTSAFALSDTQSHYLKTVMRRNAGDRVRLFNGRDGEWLAALEFSGKRGILAVPEEQTRPQTPQPRRIHLLFPPLKKDRLDILVEKAVELGATDLHPVLTERTEIREIRPERLEAQIIEAAEQCERLDIPALHPLEKLDRKLAGWQGTPLYAGLERSDATLMANMPPPAGDCAALVGPAGGWSEPEREALLASTVLVPVSLGANILRAETAALAMLVRLVA